MSHLHEILATRVDEWRRAGYPCDEHPAIAEILSFAFEDEEHGRLRYLRTAQIRALETYWYLRLVLGTPDVPALYERLFPRRGERLDALGISNDLFQELDYDEGALFERIRHDDAFVRANKLESLRETLTLDYPSYILALAMGAGKTILMGTIVATEFAMAEEYPEGPFVQNALVFAPGKTIIQSLRELADVPYARILPPRMHKPFAANLKLTFTRDGDPTINVVPGSTWNVVVTNTEKIRIQKPTGRKDKDQLALRLSTTEDEAEEIANLRLLAIASLPHLAIFSDEAHHTYGQNLLGKWQNDPGTGDRVFKPSGIKRVRRTVDYIAENTNLIVVVNTTGTPYFQRQPLRDVVVWYGLGEGIRDGVLKEVAGNIHEFAFDDAESEALVTRIVADFVGEYWSVALPDGSPARLALYFPQTDALEALRPSVEGALAASGVDTGAVLAVHSKSAKEVRDEFNRVAVDPTSPFRVLLLVNIGTEGWNCPSLFACGLVRKLRASNNFVLQAATRCLRQVEGNERTARIYLSKENRPVLAKQLEETYGTTIEELDRERVRRIEKRIELRSPELPPLHVVKRVLRFRRKAVDAGQAPLALRAPDEPPPEAGRIIHWTVVEPESGRPRLTPVEGETIAAERRALSVYGAAAELAANYHLDPGEVLAALREAYDGHDGVPEHHLPALGAQVEAQRAAYEPYHEEVEVAVALVRPDGFEREVRDGEPVYTARITFAKDRAHLYRMPESYPDAKLARARSFHYEGYNFDSDPEASYLERVLQLLEAEPDALEGVWFTGGLTDPGKTELFAEYLGEDGRWHRYTPDFVLRRKRDGKHLVVEIKRDEHEVVVRSDLDRYANGEAPQSPEGRKAVAMQRWADLNPDRLAYAVVFASTTVPLDALDRTRRFLAGE